MSARPIVIALGTRPEIIKCAPVAAELRRRGVPVRVLHTGQHYDRTLDAVFCEELELEVDLNLQIRRQSPTRLGDIISAAAPALAAWKPAWVVVQGDTVSALGCALAAHELELPVAHIEAGLRSFDWRMPEEGNRALIGRLAALHLCPTAAARELLAAEGLERGAYIVGNTIADAVHAARDRARTESTILQRLGLTSTRFALVTLHRASNVDEPIRFFELLTGLTRVAVDRELALVWPMHPRARQWLRDGLNMPWIVTEPIGYLDCQQLLAHAEAVFTDSGGLQEEACILRVPCVTLRDRTERPETVDVGANVLCYDVAPTAIDAALETVLANMRLWVSPFGDGHAAERIVDLLLSPATSRRPSGEK
jgi:UDP-N-acetylglucosamine 2-epimerase (non-hydrolysing)